MGLEVDSNNTIAGLLGQDAITAIMKDAAEKAVRASINDAISGRDDARALLAVTEAERELVVERLTRERDALISFVKAHEFDGYDVCCGVGQRPHRSDCVLASLIGAEKEAGR